MIKFFYSLSNYKPVKVTPEITQVIKIDRQKLQDGIDTFQGELDWREMWTVDDSEKRLEDGWWFYVIEKDDKYIGWAWFDIETKRFCNLYVHKDYRDSGYGKELVYARLNECKKQNIEKVWMEVDDWNIPIQKIGQELGWSPKIEYTFWTGGYDSTFYVIKSILEGKIVQPIYIDDRINHGGYHSNTLVVQRDRNDDMYPRKSTEIEFERMDWLRERIYERIPNSKELLLKTLIIDKPIKEDKHISKFVEKYNEWIPEPIYKNKYGEGQWLEAQSDIILRFQKQFGLKMVYPIEWIDGEWYEIFDCAISDGEFDSKKLPKEYSDVKVWENFTYSIRHLSKEDELDEAKKLGFDDLLYYTWTCWNPQDGESCNKCKPCKERIIECRSIGDTI
tara:strand:- start:654 stop:1826 length:1173 start_codon:yes stop_codon:yes gene_type:complete